MRPALASQHTPNWDSTALSNQFSVRSPCWHSLLVPLVRAPKRSHPEVAGSLCSHPRWTGPLQTRYLSSGDRSATLPRLKVHDLSLKLSTQSLPRHKDFVRRPIQHQATREKKNTWRKASTSEIVLRMGEAVFCRLSMGVLMKIRSTRFEMSLGVLGSLTLLCTLPGYGP